MKKMKHGWIFLTFGIGLLLLGIVILYYAIHGYTYYGAETTLLGVMASTVGLFIVTLEMVLGGPRR